MYKNIFNLVLLIIWVSASQKDNGCTRLNFLPMPNYIICGDENLKISDPCKIFFNVKVEEQDNDHIAELISFQMKHTFHCILPNFGLDPNHKTNLLGFDYKMQIQISDPSLRSAYNIQEEKYQLTITKDETYLKTKTYVGFVRGLQTFLQSIQCPRLKFKQCYFNKLPIQITDKPALPYRGLMIDTSRHFLPIHLIYETIDAMMYNKMNILHWHITDEDSFPLILQNHPEIAQYASYSPEETYTAQQARDIVNYALKRGVRVVPQLDTPGHAASWGLAPQNEGVSCTFSFHSFMGPLDVTMDKTYKLIKEVFTQIFDIFPDPIIHLGGDEVTLKCFGNKTDFMQMQNIEQEEIERHYRRKQRRILTQLNPNKKFMYWMNKKEIQIQEGDIVHWWGSALPPTQNQIVISQYGPFYLDMGVGNYLGVKYGDYQSWWDLYNQDIGQMIENYQNKENVLGAEVCLWSELSNQYIHHTKIWIRTSAFAERVWTFKSYPHRPDVLGRLTAHQRLMNRRGIPTSGATSQRCQSRPEYCISLDY